MCLLLLVLLLIQFVILENSSISELSLSGVKVLVKESKNINTDKKSN